MEIPVRTPSHSYAVTIGNGILHDALTAQHDLLTKADKIIVLTDENVCAAQQSYFEANFPYPFEVHVMPAGETCKSFENYNDVQTYLLQQSVQENRLLSHLAVVQSAIWPGLLLQHICGAFRSSKYRQQFWHMIQLLGERQLSITN